MFYYSTYSRMKQTYFCVLFIVAYMGSNLVNFPRVSQTYACTLSVWFIFPVFLLLKFVRFSNGMNTNCFLSPFLGSVFISLFFNLYVFVVAPVLRGFLSVWFKKNLRFEYYIFFLLSSGLKNFY